MNVWPVVFLASLGLALATPALAQAPCTASLAAAQAYYVDQDFAVSETLLQECVTRPDVDEATAVQVHRLLALVYLRQEKRFEAERIVTLLLSRSFGYEPDPVLDPPDYVALVESIKAPLRIEREQAVTTRETLPAAAPGEVPARQQAAPRALYAHATLGAGSYGGERGASGTSWLGDVVQNSGVSLSLGVDLRAGRTLGASVSYRLHHIPPLLTLRSADRFGEVGPQIDPETSSRWVHLVALQGRAFYPLRGRVVPYVEFGVSGAVSRINDTVRAGFGPRGGLGLDVQVAPQLAAFAGFSAALILPGNAVDHIDRRGRLGGQRSSDLLSFAEVGVRYRLVAW
ncbi:MAG: hypothetical protein AAGI91_08240 [Bacteroidota bacterium]